MNWSSKEEYEQHRKQFESQPPPAAYICFIWPDDAKWQAIAAYEPHRAQVPIVREMLVNARSTFAVPSTSIEVLVGDALNTLGEMVRAGIDDERAMGPLLMFASEGNGFKWMFASCKQVTRDDGEVGLFIQVKEMEGVTDLAGARAYVDRHPLVLAAKIRLLTGAV
jgi:hypothetical protein